MAQNVKRQTDQPAYYTPVWAAVNVPVVEQIAPSSCTLVRREASSARKLLTSRPNSTIMVWGPTRSTAAAAVRGSLKIRSQFVGVPDLPSGRIPSHRSGPAPPGGYQPCNQLETGFPALRRRRIPDSATKPLSRPTGAGGMLQSGNATRTDLLDHETTGQRR